MRITCTGPNGETFLGETNEVRPTREDFACMAESHNRAERAAVQRALDAWCKAVGVKPPTQTGEKENGSHLPG